MKKNNFFSESYEWFTLFSLLAVVVLIFVYTFFRVVFHSDNILNLIAGFIIGAVAIHVYHKTKIKQVKEKEEAVEEGS